MFFPRDDRFWVQTHSFLQQHCKPLDAVMAPNEFLEMFPGNYHYNVSYLLPINHFAFVVFHKGMVTEISRSFALEILQHFQPVFANEVFVIYAKNPPPKLPRIEQRHINPLLTQFSQDKTSRNELIISNKCAITVTTYNRPQALERSLPQILALGVPVVVVDDASLPEHYQANLQVTDKYGVPLISIPTNRGLPCAINTGISYWLADREIEWISYLQDDVDIRPDALKVLTQIQDSKERPLLTGREAPEHPSFGSDNIAGYKVILKRSAPGVHLHAHREYWAGVLPIPTPYLGAPKPDKGKPGQGADEDWWITAWSPNSITKQGGYVVCIPGLVRTFYHTAEDSTWGTVISKDPLLKA